MVHRFPCEHLGSAIDIPISVVVSSLEKQECMDCDAQGPNLWICLYKNCLRIGCSEQANDHSTLHNAAQPAHCIHMNLTTRRIWCYECKAEVFLETASTSCAENNTDLEIGTAKSKDSGHGSYSTLRTETPEKNIYGFDRSVGLNVGMSGDASEVSEDEESSCTSIEHPYGLVGLQNIGNTCYMNAALQALSNTEPLTKFFLDCSAAVHLLSEGRKPGLSRTYQALMRDIWIKKTGGYVVPSGILYGIRHVHPMFRGYQQHDTQEFLRNFMDQLHEELKQVVVLEPTPITADCDTFSLAIDDPTLSSSYDSSEGEYETCDSGVSERSSLSDDTERPSSSTKRRLSRCGSPNRRQRPRVQNCNVIDSQPSTSATFNQSNTKKQLKFRSIISDIFDGKLLSSVQCLTCNRVSSRIETFQDLSLPIPSRDHLAVLHGRSIPGTTCSEAVIPVQDGWITWMLSWLKSWFYGPTITLHDCLAAFFSTDELKGDNMYSCEKCNKLRNGIKFSKVLQLPEVLCIHLKRFRHELMFSSKISAAVSFPLKGLDMRPYLHSDCTSTVSNYELFSVICHHGTAGGGHYICYAYNAGNWYEFDDQYVTRVSSDKVQTCEAYVLFYRKVTTAIEHIKSEAASIAENIAETNLISVYISRQWLNRFHCCAEPGPIDNSDFLCHHGSINPDRNPFMNQLAVLVPVELYDYLHSKFGGCPVLTNVSVCPACQAIRDVHNYDIPQTHYLSLSWYSQWNNFVQRKSIEPPGPIDNSKININHLDLNDVLLISEDTWKFFYSTYGGGPEVKIKPILYEDNTTYDCESEWHGFGLPPMQQNDVQKKNNNEIDQSLYSSGEPMETENENNAEDNADSENIAETDHSKNGYIENDIEDEESTEIRSSSKHRRRRKFLTGL